MNGKPVLPLLMSHGVPPPSKKGKKGGKKKSQNEWFAEK